MKIIKNLFVLFGVAFDEKNAIKRGQSRTCSNYAEREQFIKISLDANQTNLFI